jgi:hypothetical protein
MNRLEKLWILLLNTVIPNGYNILIGAVCEKRRPLTEEHKRKISEGGKRAWRDPITRANQLAGLDKNHTSPTANLKRAAAVTAKPGRNLGRKLSEEWINNMRIAQANRKRDKLGRFLS